MRHFNSHSNERKQLQRDGISDLLELTDRSHHDTWPIVRGGPRWGQRDDDHTDNLHNPVYAIWAL